VGRHRDLDRARAARVRAAEPDVVVNKAGKRLKGVQQGLNLQLNSWSPGRGLACSFFNSQATRPTDDQLFFCPPRARSRRLWAGAGERRRRASELLFAAPPVATRNGLAPPPPRGAPGTPEHRLHNLSKKGLQKPGISPKSPADYGTDPEKLALEARKVGLAAKKVNLELRKYKDQTAKTKAAVTNTTLTPEEKEAAIRQIYGLA